MRYLPKSESERRQMLDVCGAGSPEELFSHLPEAARLHRPLDLPPGISEYEIVEYFTQRAAENGIGYTSFLGAGVYRHYRPVLVDTVVSRGEFLTSYTPYQAEISQGTLTAIFEFQTMICQLTGMDVANASMYDGSTAVPEAAMMAVRATGKGRVLVAKTVHPEYREVLRTYARNQGMPVEEFGYVEGAGTLDLEDLERKLDDFTGAVIIQSPNFFGIVEQVKAAAEIAHKRGALLVLIFTEAVSLGILEPPADADIVAGELQSFAITPSYGGPYAGIIATKEKLIRQMPGRLVGQTDGFARQSRLLPDAGHARAAHPPREGHQQHLHQPGADRADGDGLHVGIRQAGAARTGGTEPGQVALPGRQADAALQPGSSSTNSSPRSARPTRSIKHC